MRRAAYVRVVQAGQPLLAPEDMADLWNSQHNAAGQRLVYLETYGCQMNVADSEARTPCKLTWIVDGFWL